MRELDQRELPGYLLKYPEVFLFLFVALTFLESKKRCLHVDVSSAAPPHGQFQQRLVRVQTKVQRIQKKKVCFCGDFIISSCETTFLSSWLIHFHHLLLPMRPDKCSFQLV